MSIPLDRLYHYIESVAQEVYGDTIIYRFWPHGSKNINDLTRIRHISHLQHRLNPEIICHDQEPLEYDLYQEVVPFVGRNLNLWQIQKIYYQNVILDIILAMFTINVYCYTVSNDQKI